MEKISPRTLLMNMAAGLSVASLLLPESVAYSAIAGVPPIHALVATLVGLCLYPWVGSSRFAVMAPTSSAAAIFASIAAQGGPGMGYALAGFTGLAFLAAAVLRAGFLGSFVSQPVMRGFTLGLSITIVIKQLPHLLGVPVSGTTVGPILAQLWAQHPEWQNLSMGISAVSLLLWLLLFHGLKRWKVIPVSFVVLALAWAGSSHWDWGGQGVALVGRIELSGLSFSLPDLSRNEWLRAAELAPALLMLVFAESWGAVRTLAARSGDTLNANRELLALGVGNLVSGLVQGLPVGASMSASMANQSTGVAGRWTGLATALALAVLLLEASHFLALLPKAALAAVVVGILSDHLNPMPLIRSLRWGRDAWIAVVAAVGVLAFGVQFGMLLAVLMSLLVALKQFSKPDVAVLGHLLGTHDYLDSASHPEVLVPKNLLIVRPEQPLFFANVEQVLKWVGDRALRLKVATVVMSLEESNNLDVTSVNLLAEFKQFLDKNQITLLLARIKDAPREALFYQTQAAHLGTAPACYWSVSDAVAAATTATVTATAASAGTTVNAADATKTPEA